MARATRPPGPTPRLGTTEVHLKGTKKWAHRYYGVAGTTIAPRTNETGTEKLRFLASDHHGTGGLSLTADTAQRPTKRCATPFGSARGTTSGTWPDDKTFLGRPTDTGTNLTHIGTREYDPGLGQFISVDPAEGGEYVGGTVRNHAGGAGGGGPSVKEMAQERRSFWSGSMWIVRLGRSPGFLETEQTRMRSGPYVSRTLLNEIGASGILSNAWSPRG
ncbi:hypothetical protein ACIRQY_11015 [Streptomyces sp. NPDC101490]|uniref:hypothetical protein n=1 Tax=Streptomyces sp. NPDC101490 TaxID=3366143 RepID=UPI003801922B